MAGRRLRRRPAVEAGSFRWRRGGPASSTAPAPLGKLGRRLRDPRDAKSRPGGSPAGRAGARRVDCRPWVPRCREDASPGEGLLLPVPRLSEHAAPATGAPRSRRPRRHNHRPSCCGAASAGADGALCSRGCLRHSGVFLLRGPAPGRWRRLRPSGDGCCAHGSPCAAGRPRPPGQRQPCVGRLLQALRGRGRGVRPGWTGRCQSRGQAATEEQRWPGPGGHRPPTSEAQICGGRSGGCTSPHCEADGGGRFQIQRHGGCRGMEEDYAGGQGVGIARAARSAGRRDASIQVQHAWHPRVQA
mmetsp:Transcript_17711/g.41473  ORF Transcript_17711/g.41473 Transcript_17711/m.41473 type:complete len:301 (+) Transcript_17711:266-1168(+)